MSPVCDGLVTNAPAVTGAHGHAPDAHVVHDGVSWHGPDQSQALSHHNQPIRAHQLLARAQS